MEIIETKREEFDNKVVKVATIVQKYLSDNLLRAEGFRGCMNGKELYEQLLMYIPNS